MADVAWSQGGISGGNVKNKKLFKRKRERQTHFDSQCMSRVCGCHLKSEYSPLDDERLSQPFGQPGPPMQIISLYSPVLAPARGPSSDVMFCQNMREPRHFPVLGQGSQHSRTTQLNLNSAHCVQDSIYSLLSALPRPFFHCVFAPINSVLPSVQSVSKHLISTNIHKKLRETTRVT